MFVALLPPLHSCSPVTGGGLINCGASSELEEGDSATALEFMSREQGVREGMTEEEDDADEHITSVDAAEAEDKADDKDDIDTEDEESSRDRVDKSNDDDEEDGEEEEHGANNEDEEQDDDEAEARSTRLSYSRSALCAHRSRARRWACATSVPMSKISTACLRPSANRPSARTHTDPNEK